MEFDNPYFDEIVFFPYFIKIEWISTGAETWFQFREAPQSIPFFQKNGWPSLNRAQISWALGDGDAVIGEGDAVIGEVDTWFPSLMFKTY